MSRNAYRHTVRILRRAQGGEKGGYDGDRYEEVAVTSAGVRDESEAEYASAESARIEHIRTAHRVRRVDRYENNGREIRVRAAVSRSRYSVGTGGEADGQTDG